MMLWFLSHTFLPSVYNNKLPLKSDIEEQPSLVLIVLEAASVLMTVPVLTSKISPAPLPKYQWEASACEYPKILVNMRQISILIFINL